MVVVSLAAWARWHPCNWLRLPRLSFRTHHVSGRH